MNPWKHDDGGDNDGDDDDDNEFKYGFIEAMFFYLYWCGKMLSLLKRFSVLNRPTKSVCGFRFILVLH